MEKKIIFFDVETNGTSNKFSVLSMSAMKVSYNIKTQEMKKIDEFDRFYFRNEGELPNEGALNINGLYDDVIEQKRTASGILYARTFKEDMTSFYNFCDNAEHFVAHNIKFDRSFIDFLLPYQFDTMLENVNIVKVPSPSYGGYKWPKLLECANYYNIPIDEDELHNSMYDVLVTGRVFYKMTKLKETKSRIDKFIIENMSTDFR